MKVLNKACQILALIFGISAIVLFFTNFVNIVSSGNAVSFVGSRLAFGGGEYGLAKSADIWFCLIITVLATVFSGFTFVNKGMRYAAPSFGIVAAVYMLVIALGEPRNFVDTRPLKAITDVEYSGSVLLCALALCAFTVFAVAHLLIDDYIIALESKGQKLTIIKRIARFFKEYKSEVKRIIWPGPKSVVKNTFVVLAVCAAVGIVIWLVDLGLGQLLKLI